MEHISYILCDHVSCDMYGHLLLMNRSISKYIGPYSNHVAKRELYAKHGLMICELEDAGLWEGAVREIDSSFAAGDYSKIYGAMKNCKTRLNVYKYVVNNISNYKNYEQFANLYGLILNGEAESTLKDFFREFLTRYNDLRPSLTFMERLTWVSYIMKFLENMINDALALPNAHNCKMILRDHYILRIIVSRCNEFKKSIDGLPKYKGFFDHFDNLMKKTMNWTNIVREKFLDKQPVYTGSRGGRYLLLDDGKRQYLPRM